MLHLVVLRCRLWGLRYGLNSALFCVFVCVHMKAVGCCFHVWQMRVSNFKEKCWYSFCSISQIKKSCIQYDTLFGVSLSHECLIQKMVVFAFPFLRWYDKISIERNQYFIFTFSYVLKNLSNVSLQYSLLNTFDAMKENNGRKLLFLWVWLTDTV